MAFCISDRFCVVWMSCSKIRSSQLAWNSQALAFSLNHAAYAFVVLSCVGLILRNTHLAWCSFSLF